MTARTLVFTTIVIGEVCRAFAARSTTKVFFETPVLGNMLLLAVVCVTVLVQLGLQYVPITRELLGIEPLAWRDAALSLGLGLLPATGIELVKLGRRAVRRG
jgi:Ca2+-transporting ATPase